MTPRIPALVAGVLGALLVASPSRAAEGGHAFASIAQISFQVTDLDLTDGVAPALSLDPANASTLLILGFSAQGTAWPPLSQEWANTGWMTPDRRQLGQDVVEIGGDSAAAYVVASNAMEQHRAVAQSLGQTPAANGFWLTPFSRLEVSALAVVDVGLAAAPCQPSTTFAGQLECQRTTANVGLTAYNEQLMTFPSSDTGSRTLFAELLGDGGGTSKHLEGLLNLVVENDTAVPQYVQMAVQAGATINLVTVVPEPATVWLLLAGGLLLRMRARRRR